MRHRGRRAFTLTELIVVIMIIAMMIAILLPVVSTGHHGSRRTMCLSNLRQIGYAMTLYANNNRGAFPRTRASAGPDRVPVFGTGAAATQPFAAAGPAENDVTAALFLLLRTPKLRPMVFVCPAANQDPDPFAGDGTTLPLTRANFTDFKRNLSYSYQNPYPSYSALAGGLGFSAKIIGTDYAIVADRNPGARGGNSINHDGNGQNVLYGDSHASFQATPLAGPRDPVSSQADDIYHTADGKIVASPATMNDTILLPTD